MKECTKCKTVKSVTSFTSCKISKDGLSYSCNQCKAKYNRERYRSPVEKDKKRTYYEKNKVEILYKKKQREVNNPEHHSKLIKKSWLKRMSNPINLLKNSLRHRTTSVITYKKFQRNTDRHSFLGISYELLIIHIERQFQKGMTWENHGRGPGKWQIDHIIPLASANTLEEVYERCHYTNLQPLWWIENLTKNARVPMVQLKMTI